MRLSLRTVVVHRILFVTLLFLAAAACYAQQDDIKRYSVYTGFVDLSTPGLNSLNQIGFHLQTGYNPKRFLGGGFDYSIASGDTSLTANLATSQLQAQLAALAAKFAQEGLLPPGYTLNIPLHTVTQSFTAGVQFEDRHFEYVTLFIRPSLSAFRIHSTGHPNPQDLFAVTVTNILAPTGSLTDWTGAYGVGGGADVKFSDHLWARTQLDVVWNHPFSNLLADGYWTYRFSIGPVFKFGPNIVRGHHTKS